MASTTTLLARDLLYAEEDDDYIDMEVSSFSNLFSYSETTTSPHPVVVANEFEFQMSSSSSINNVVEKEPTTSPADELFYKGKLLPLHLPPRLQMVEKLLQNTNNNNNNNNSTFDYKEEHENEEFYSSRTPLAATTTFTTPIAGTPFESCNISPSESCQISRELNPEEYYYYGDNNNNRSTEFVIENYNYKMKSWTKKLKECSLGSKLKASRAYLKSWFGKSGCSYETYGTSTKVADEGSVSKASWEVINKKVVQGAKKNPFGQIQQRHRNQVVVQSISSSVKDEMKSTTTSEEMNESNNSHHDHDHRRRRRSRRSFSVVGIKLLSAGNKSSTSTSSSSSYGISEAHHHHHHLKRCSSSTASSEIENSIQGAIAHCKKSHQMLSSRN